MKAILYLSAVVLLAVCATWAYRVNYATQDALNHVGDLRRDIAEEREALAVLRAEWAYLNRPDRLRELVAANAEALGLVELAPEQFGEVAEVPFPPAPPPPVEDAPDARSDAPAGPPGEGDPAEDGATEGGSIDDGAIEGARPRPAGHAALAPTPMNGAYE